MQAETEQWFVRRGLPHFIRDYSATEDVLTRALPLLTLIFLVSSVSGIDLDWPWWGITLAIVAGFGLLIAAWAGLNRIRGRSPLALPSRVGWVEIGAFLLIPSLLPLVFGGDVTGALVTLATLLIILLLVYAVTSYALLAMAWWAARQMVRSLGQTLSLFARGLPLLLLGFMFLFINAEAWQSAGRVEEQLLLLVFGLFLLLGSAFLVVQIPRELQQLNRFRSGAEVAEYCLTTPVEGADLSREGSLETEPLARREWANVGLVVFVSQALRILLLSALIGGFFVVFGLLIVRPDTASEWTGAEPAGLGPSLSWLGAEVRVTRELLQVSGFLAAFAGLYFSVYSITESTFRREFFDDTIEEIRQALAVRLIYLRSIGER